MSDMEKKDDNWIPQSYPIPAHWIYTELETAFENLPLTGKKLAQKDYDIAGKIPVIDQGASEIGGYSNYQEKVVKPKHPVIIFGDHTKCLKYIAYPFIPGADGIKVLLPNSGIDPKFAFYACKSIRLPDRGYSRHFSFLKKCDFPLPPFNEQKRIVAKIEELFSELDNGITALKTVHEQLKVYRQAVLKHAFEGKLTAKWREENADKLESPEQLLARIQQEREARYQQQLDKWKIAVKEWESNDKDGKKPGKPKESAQLDLLESALPFGWLTVSLNWLLTTEKKPMTTGPFGTALKKSEHQSEGVPVLGIENIGNGKFISGNKIFVTEEKAEELKPFKIHPGEIVISRSGTVGEICEVPEKVNNALISTNLLRVSLDNKFILSPFFVLMFQGGCVKLQVKNLCKGSSREFLNQSILSSIKYPVCGLEEQKALLEQLEIIFSNIEQQEKEIVLSLEKAETLRQSILKKAFSGQLVPQDPNDEPASGLLARIQAEKEAINTQRSKKTRKMPSMPKN